MRMYDIILKKRNGGELTEEEIRFAVNGFVDGSVPDYQMSALAMAIVWRSMTDMETAILTDAMANSGDMLDLSRFGDLSVDKHSTGGVGDKTTLIVAPIVASCGAKIAKMSGRGLGHTGGTVDKLESIHGFKTELSHQDFMDQADRIGVSVIGQSGNMTPADKKLYALRDVTATVDSIPLIVSSIMSKKLAAGAKNIVLDVKMGSGAFMTDLDSATALAEKMVAIGKKCGRNTAALITNMDMPLGSAVGNSLEVIEAIKVLKNEIKNELRELCLALSANMLSLCFDKTYDEALGMATDALDSGKAFEKFKEWIKAQGGNSDWADDISLIPEAKYELHVRSKSNGWITHMNTEEIGIASSLLGAGRIKKEDKIDFSAGIVVVKKTGDYVRKGGLLAVLHTNDESTFDAAYRKYYEAIEIGRKEHQKLPLIFKTVR